MLVAVRDSIFGTVASAKTNYMYIVEAYHHIICFFHVHAIHIYDHVNITLIVSFIE